MKSIQFSATRFVLIAVIIAVIVLNFINIEVNETLKNIAISLISFYFGQKTIATDTNPVGKGINP